MKTSNLILGIAAAAGLYLLLSKGEARADINNGTFGAGVYSGEYQIPAPSAAPGSVQSEQMKNYSQAVDYFNQTPSIQAGINVINAGFPIGSLPRTSQTLKVLGQNDTIARLGDGSTARITATPAARDSAGMTNFDRIIARNKAR